MKKGLLGVIFVFVLVFSLGIVSAVPCGDDLVAYYKFDGDLTDSSWNAYDGVLHSGGSVSYGTGISGNSIIFSGNDFVKALNFNYLGESYTMGAWVKTTSIQKYNGVVSFSTAASNTRNDLFLYYDANGHRIATITPTTAIRYSIVNNGFSDGEWHHVVSIFDGVSTKFYLDSVEVPYSNYAAAGKNGIFSEFRIGAWVHSNTASYFFNGEIDEAAIWNRVLSQSEIQAIYTDGVAGNAYCEETVPVFENCQDNLVAYYKFGNNLKDSSGNGFDGEFYKGVDSAIGGETYFEGRNGEGVSILLNSDGDNLIDGAVDERVVLDIPADLSIADGITISGWAYSNKKENKAGFLAKNNYGANSYTFLAALYGYKGEGYIGWYSDNANSGTWEYEGPDLYSLNQWEHFTWVYRDAVVEYYVNGEIVGQDYVALVDDGRTNDKYSIGSWFPGSAADLVGRIDEVAFWNRSLSKYEVKAVYENSNNLGEGYCFDKCALRDQVILRMKNIKESEVAIFGSDIGSDVFSISSDELNVNLYDKVMEHGWDGVSPVDVNVTIESSVIVGSNNVNKPAFEVGNFPEGSNIRVINEGWIVGKGGAGGDARGSIKSGENGGVAFRTTSSVVIDNQGAIAGGAGGGGAGGASSILIDGCGGQVRKNGGGGGGGVGSLGGLGGLGFNSGTDGTFLEVGIGGEGDDYRVYGCNAYFPPGGYYHSGDGGNGSSLGESGLDGTNGSWGSTPGFEAYIYIPKSESYGGAGGAAGSSIVGSLLVTFEGVKGDVRGPEIAEAESVILEDIWSYELCYDEIFEGTYGGPEPSTCDSGNSIIWLSSAVDSLASVIGSATYNIPVCYGDLSCEVKDSGACSVGYETVLRLDSSSEPSLVSLPGADPVAHPVKVCCGSSGVVSPASGEMYWADANGVPIPEGKEPNIGDTVQAVVTVANSGTFDIWENDGLTRIDDDVIKTDVSGEDDGFENWVYRWKITQADLDNADGDFDEFYFNIDDSDNESNTIAINGLYDDTAMDITIVSPNCGDNFTAGDVSIEIAASDEDDFIEGNVSINGVNAKSFTNGEVTFVYPFPGVGNYQIVAEAVNSRGKRARHIANIIVLDEQIPGKYVAACIAEPKDFSDLDTSVVTFNASTTVGIEVNSSGITIVRPGENDRFSWYWSFSTGHSRNLGDYVENRRDGYYFSVTYPTVGQNSASLRVEFI